MMAQPSYAELFQPVLARRLRYALNAVLLWAAAVATGIVALAPLPGLAIVPQTLYVVGCVGVALAAALYGRHATTTTEFSLAKSLAAHTARLFTLRRLAVVLAVYVTLSLVFFAGVLPQTPWAAQYYVLAKEYRRRPAANDTWVWFWFHGWYAGVLYAGQHLIFQRNRLRAVFGVPAVPPQTALLRNVPYLAGAAVTLTLATAGLLPVVYWCLRRSIFRVMWPVFRGLGLDPQPSTSFSIGVFPYCVVLAATLAAVATWELANHCYECYAGMGCLDRGQLISSKASDPAAALVSGLQDLSPQNELARLTNFQELAYIATAKTKQCAEIRRSIYNPPAAHAPAWPALYAECALVINSTASHVNYRTPADLAALRDPQATKSTSLAPIFGNSASSDKPHELKNFGQPAQASAPAQDQTQQGMAFLKHLDRCVSTLSNLVSQKLQAAAPAQYKAVKSLLSSQPVGDLKRAATTARHSFLASAVGFPFRNTAKRDAESRVLNTVNFGNAVIALAGLILHAIEEDHSGTITAATISDTLSLLENAIRSCANYIDHPPASVAPSSTHVVALIHDVAMSEFFNLCVRYNYKLNDLLMSPKAFTLAKWVIDVSIAQQKTELRETRLF